MHSPITRCFILIGLAAMFSCSKQEETVDPNSTTASFSKIELPTNGKDSIMNMGWVFPNHKPIIWSFEIRNVGGKEFTVTDINLPNNFSLEEPFSPFKVSGYSNHYVRIRFAASAVGTYSGKVKIQSDADEGSSEIYITGKCTTTAEDYDGNVYNIVKIGDQLWLKENFRGTHYANGDPINDYRFLTDPALDQIYGKYYDRDACYFWPSSSNRVQRKGVFVEGFRVPRNTDWQELIDEFGGDAIAGGKLKQTGTSLWQSPNVGATNQSGFTALPAGSISNGTTYNLGTAALFHSYKQNDPDIYDWSYKILLSSGNSEVFYREGGSLSYLSLRLVQ